MTKFDLLVSAKSITRHLEMEGGVEPYIRGDEAIEDPKLTVAQRETLEGFMKHGMKLELSPDGTIAPPSEDHLVSPTKISVGGIWLRKEGNDRIVVLAEVNGEWKVLITETWPLDGEGEISHIIEPNGISRSIVDEALEDEEV